MDMDGGGEISECVEDEDEDEGDAEAVGSGKRCVRDVRVVEKLEFSRWNG